MRQTYCLILSIANTQKRAPRLRLKLVANGADGEKTLHKNETLLARFMLTIEADATGRFCTVSMPTNPAKVYVVNDTVTSGRSSSSPARPPPSKFPDTLPELLASSEWATKV